MAMTSNTATRKVGASRINNADASTATTRKRMPLNLIQRASVRSFIGFPYHLRSFDALGHNRFRRYSSVMNIVLDKDVEDFLKSRVRAGVISAPDEFVNDLVRSIRDQRDAIRVTPELETWLLEAAEGSVTPLTHEDFSHIRERAKNGHSG